MTYTTRYTHLAAQRAYERRIVAGGLRALLEPYDQTRPVIPAQRSAGSSVGMQETPARLLGRPGRGRSD